MFGLPTTAQNFQQRARDLGQEAKDTTTKLNDLRDSAQQAQRAAEDLQSQANSARKLGEDLLQAGRDTRDSLSRLPDPEVPEDWNALSDLFNGEESDQFQVLLPEDEIFDDIAEPEPASEAADVPEFSKDEEQATAVLRVCRNGWNTIDTRAAGGHWFSA